MLMINKINLLLDDNDFENKKQLYSAYIQEPQ